MVSMKKKMRMREGVVSKNWCEICFSLFLCDHTIFEHCMSCIHFIIRGIHMIQCPSFTHKHTHTHINTHTSSSPCVWNHQFKDVSMSQIHPGKALANHGFQGRPPIRFPSALLSMEGTGNSIFWGCQPSWEKHLRPKYSNNHSSVIPVLNPVTPNPPVTPKPSIAPTHQHPINDTCLLF